MLNLFVFSRNNTIKMLLMSLEISPLAALYHLPIQKICFIGIKVVAGGGMLMPTALPKC